MESRFDKDNLYPSNSTNDNQDTITWTPSEYIPPQQDNLLPVVPQANPSSPPRSPKPEDYWLDLGITIMQILVVSLVCIIASNIIAPVVGKFNITLATFIARFMWLPFAVFLGFQAVSDFRRKHG